MPDPVRLLQTLRRAVQAFRHTPGRHGRLIELSYQAVDCLVAGDLHGNIGNFKRLLELADLAHNPRRHMVVQELVHGKGQYPNDGGDQSHRLLDLVGALKIQYPDRVHFLIGNHELSQWTQRDITKNDLDLNESFSKGVQTAYGQHASTIYEAYCEMIAAVPVAVRLPNRVFLSHSLPGANRLDKWELDELRRDEYVEDDYKLGGCVHAVVWGRDTAETTAQRYLAKVDADLLVTGHIPCDDGFALPNPYQVILDCKDERACACLIPMNRRLTQVDLVECLVRLNGG